MRKLSKALRFPQPRGRQDGKTALGEGREVLILIMNW